MKLHRGLVPALSVIAVLGLGVMMRGSLPPVLTNSWAAGGPMTAARTGACAVLLVDGRVLLVGGTGAQGAPLSTVDMMDGISGAFAPAPPMLEARGRHACAALSDGRVMVTGGVTAGGAAAITSEFFDPATNSWSPGPNLPGAGRAGHTMSVLGDGKVLIAGGESGGATLNSIEAFDPETGAFSAAGSLAGPRKDHGAATLLDGRVWLGGGSDGAQELAASEIYDPSTGATAPGGALSAPRSGFAAFLLPNNGHVLIAGGSKAGNALASAEVYRPWMGVTLPAATMASPRANATGAPLQVERYAVIAGGSNLASSELYGFATLKTDKDDYSPGETVLITGKGWQPGETVELQLKEIPQWHGNRVYWAIADASGDISSSFIVETHDLGVRFFLTGIGASSALQAQHTFTDARQFTAAISPTTASVGPFVNYTITIVNTSSGSPTGPIGSAQVAIPSGMSVTAGTVNVLAKDPGNITRTWAVNGLTSSVIRVTRDISGSGAGDHDIDPGGTVEISFSASATTTGSKSWNTSAHSGTNQGGTIFALVGGQPTVTVTADSTPPVITPNVAGTLGNNGWYTSNVAVTWTVTDPDSTVTSTTGCGPTNISTDTTGLTLTCSATSSGGNSSQSVTIKRDATAPAVAPNPPGDSCTVPGLNGWCRGSQTAAFTASDSTSGLASPALPSFTQSTSTEGASVNIPSGSVCDTAGNCNPGVNAGPYKIDAAAPSATILTGPPAITNQTSASFTFSGADNLTASANLTFECRLDAGSFAPCASPHTVPGLTEGAHTLHLRAIDAAGNVSAPPQSHAWTVDTTAPSVTITFTPDGNNGWFKTDPAVGGASATDANAVASISCSNGSLVQGALAGGGTTSASRSLTVSTNGTHTISCTATDTAGNTSGAVQATVKIDSVAPSISLNAAADSCSLPGLNGWCRGAQTAGFTATDATSGLANAAQASFTQSTSTQGAAVTIPSGSVCDVAGNCNTGIDAGPYKIDSTAPTATILTSPPAMTNATSASFTFNGTDNLTAAASLTFECQLDGGAFAPCASPQPYNSLAEGSHTFALRSIDLAGNASAPPVSHTWVVDTTPPALTVNFTPDGSNGWFKTDPAAGNAAATDANAVASISCSNGTLVQGALVGQNTPGASRALTVSGNGTHTISCTATDTAGNTSGAVQATVKIDSVAPSISLNAAADSCSLPGLNGWCRGAQTAGFTAADVTSGLANAAQASFTQSASTQGAAVSIPSGAVCDLAGNCNAGLNAGPYKIDSTIPLLSGGRAPAANSFGWNNTDVVVTFGCVDAISGVMTAPLSPQTISTEGPNQSASASCTDVAGNVSTLAVTNISIDKTLPVIANVVANPIPLNGSGSVTAQITEALSGVDSVNYVITDAGNVQVASGALALSGSSYTGAITPFTAATGLYMICVSANDKAGNDAVPLCALLAVYDASAGFVTGGGWIMSPEGAYFLDPSLTGKANFGFVAKYKKGQSIPDGQTQFQFHAAGLNFHSTSYQWLVVNGTKAQFKGRGAINGQGDYNFILSAVDGDLLPKSSPGYRIDKFRIKIMSRNADGSDGATIYDNQFGQSDLAEPSTTLGGGSIQIQAK